MKKLLLPLASGILVLALTPAPASAAPIHVVGNTCPSALGTDPNSHQFRVDDATNCVWDDTSTNIQGDADEVTAYLEGFYGTGWVGLGETNSAGTGIDGLTVTCLGGCDGAAFGSFSYVGTSAQIAFGLKDGASPHWAIFILPEGDFGSNWSIFPQGGFSHATLYVRGELEECEFDCEEPLTPVPEPATLTMLGLGLLGAAGARRRRMKQAQ